ncbi:MAG: hypothetical protein AAFV07_05845 [Bacteroidota bacterium]
MKSLLLTLALTSLLLPFSLPEGGSLHDAPDGGQIWVGTKTQNAKGPQDIWVIKTNAIGQEVWSKTYGGSAWDRGADIQPTRDGGYILLGSTSSYGVGNYDVFLLKLDHEGEVEWQQTYGAFHNDYGFSVVELANGYLVEGQQQLCGTQNDFNTCIDVPWRLKTDLRGTLTWQERGPQASY